MHIPIYFKVSAIFILMASITMVLPIECNIYNSHLSNGRKILQAKRFENPTTICSSFGKQETLFQNDKNLFRTYLTYFRRIFTSIAALICSVSADSLKVASRPIFKSFFSKFLFVASNENPTIGTLYRIAPYIL